MYRIKSVFVPFVISCTFFILTTLPAMAENVATWQGNPFQFLPPQETAPIPTAISFEILDANCSETASWDFFVNGVSVGSQAASCVSDGGTQKFTVAQADLAITHWLAKANELRATKNGGSGSAVTFVKAAVKTATVNEITYLKQGVQPH